MSIKQKEHKLSSASMRGRMAYTIMCVEAFLVTQYPDRDWTIIAERMWEATDHDWGYWPIMFSNYIPDVVLAYPQYSQSDFGKDIDEETFTALKQLFSGITQGIEDDPNDPLNYLICKPFEMGMVYEGTEIGDGSESFEIIDETERMLIKYSVNLPDYRKVLFSSFEEFYGWGDLFDGRFLSIILNK